MQARSSEQRLYRDGLTQDPGTDPLLQRGPVHQVDFHSQEFGKGIFQPDIFKERSDPVEFDENIQVAPLPLLPVGIGTEYPEGSYPVLLPELWQVLVENGADLFKGLLLLGGLPFLHHRSISGLERCPISVLR